MTPAQHVACLRIGRYFIDVRKKPMVSIITKEQSMAVLCKVSLVCLSSVCGVIVIIKMSSLFADSHCLTTVAVAEDCLC